MKPTKFPIVSVLCYELTCIAHWRNTQSTHFYTMLSSSSSSSSTSWVFLDSPLPLLSSSSILYFFFLFCVHYYFYYYFLSFAFCSVDVSPRWLRCRNALFLGIGRVVVRAASQTGKEWNWLKRIVSHYFSRTRTTIKFTIFESLVCIAFAIHCPK